MTSYQDLLSQRAILEKQTAELEKALAAALRAERSGIINQIKSLMAEHGLTVADLGGKLILPKIKNGKVSANAGRKVAAKYKNALTGEAWSGRGLQPKWLKKAIAEGKKLEDFAI